MNVKLNDTVVVIAGKDKGKTGKVVNTYPKAGRVDRAGRQPPEETPEGAQGERRIADHRARRAPSTPPT